jgi:TetR/AcrR family transcriptional repressor of nem operon
MASHPTHDKLIDAALLLAGDRPLATIPVEDIAREAGVAKGTFYVHFADRGAFLAAVARRVHRRLVRATVDAVGTMPPGAERLAAGAIAYLDASLAQVGAKSTLLESRFEPAVAIEAARCKGDAAMVMLGDVEALGMPDPMTTARLFAALVAEAALIELESGGADPSARAALLALLPHADTTVRTPDLV